VFGVGRPAHPVAFAVKTAMRSIRAWTPDAFEPLSPQGTALAGGAADDLGTWRPTWPAASGAMPTFKGVTGRDVVIGVIDSGVDVTFPGFVTLGSDGVPRTRIEAIWDMSIDYMTEAKQSAERDRALNELSRLQDEAAQSGHSPADVTMDIPSYTGVKPDKIDGRRYGWLFPAHDIETYLATIANPGHSFAPFRSFDENGHGTSCMACAASHGAPKGHLAQEVIGAAPEAALVVVKFNHDCGDTIYSYQSGKKVPVGYQQRLADGIAFIRKQANGRPWVVSISQGGMGGFSWPTPNPHGYPDGRGLKELHEAAKPIAGGCVVIAAGNNGSPGSVASYASAGRQAIAVKTYHRTTKSDGVCAAQPSHAPEIHVLYQYIYVPTNKGANFSFSLCDGSWRAFELDKTFVADLTRIYEWFGVSGSIASSLAPAGVVADLIEYENNPVDSKGAVKRRLQGKATQHELGTVSGKTLHLLSVDLKITVPDGDTLKTMPKFPEDVFRFIFKPPDTADASLSSDVVVHCSVMSKSGAVLEAGRKDVTNRHFGAGSEIFRPGATDHGLDLTRKFQPNGMAALTRAIVVGAFDPDSTARDASYFSSRGPLMRNDTLFPDADAAHKPDISAPGEHITVPSPNRAPSWDNAGPAGHLVDITQGASMATPIAAGVAALMLQVNPTLDADDIWGILRTTADRGANAPPAFTGDRGYGAIDAYGAVLAAAAHP